MSYPGPYLTGTPSFDDVHEYQDTDDLQGGPGQIDNWQAQALMNRTEYLLLLATGYAAITTVLSSAGASPVLTPTQLKGKIVLLTTDSNTYMNATLPDANTYGAGGAVNLQRVRSGFDNPVTLTAAAGDSFIDHNNVSSSVLYLHRNEGVTLIAISANVWHVNRFDGNHYDVGDQMLGYTQKAGTLTRDGSTYNRADYPRLWAWAVANGLTVADATWSVDSGGGANPRYPNKGLFSQGNGTTTFKVPDDRGIFDRAMTYGAGSDVDRVGGGVGSAVGNVQGHIYTAHAHTTTQSPHTHTLNDPGHNHTVNDAGHNHGHSDPGHNHSVNDPGHVHGVSDPGHFHQTLNALSDTTLDDTGGADRLVTGSNSNEPFGSLSSRTGSKVTGVSVQSAPAGVSNNAAATGMTNVAAVTGVSNNAAGTGMSNNTASIVISVNNSGGNETRPVNVAKHPLIIF